MLIVIRSTSILLALAIVSCSERPTAPAHSPCPSQVVDVHVSPGLTPTITWSPACAIGSIYVERLTGTGRSPAWLVFKSNNDIRSGVEFGSRGDVTEPLQPGG